MESIPDTFKAVLVNKGKVYVEEVETQPLKEGEVRVRVEATPVNPSDRMVVEGVYGIKELLNPQPTGMGFEGAGVVVEVHESVGEDLIGKTVALSDNAHRPEYQGIWRQYIAKPAQSIIPIPDGIEPSQVCAAYVNPLTTILMINQAKKFGHKALIHGAACSALGKMLVRYANKLGFPVIHVVRRQEQVDILKDIGAEHILDSSTETFDEDLKKLSSELNATAYFDPICGSFCTRVLTQMPAGSTAYVYGALSGEPVTLSPIDIIFYQKSVSYLYLSIWMKEATQEEIKEAVGTVVEDLVKGGEIFGSKIYETYSLDNVNEAIEAAVKDATKGKICINPQL
ncbi:unnamed protein product [Moneuplotes crassus]|uniref:Enoyl reductase (ER) domain-containing protein n=1 Tax=Euplotes crassus TaxID=5936 RepID=A0AAD1XK01_EUPCR|nr:unnamed protein product [Moneuplotes crassus]